MRIKLAAAFASMCLFAHGIATNWVNSVATKEWAENSLVSQSSLSNYTGDVKIYGRLGVGYGASASGKYSFSRGISTKSSGQGSEAHGYHATSSNLYSYAWNGDNSLSGYGSHGTGTYNINPVNGLYGFFIGDATLYDIFASALSRTNEETAVFLDEEENETSRTFPPLPIMRQSDLAPLQNSVNAMWATMYGETVWIAVTNYMRQIAGTVPSLRLWEVRDSNTNLVYSSAEEIEHVTTQKVHTVETNLLARMPRTAWGSYQSSGEDNPSSNAVTVVNSEKVMLTGGGKWYKAIETGGRSIWVLHFRGLQTVGGDANGFFRVCDAEGNAQLEIVKTADQIVSAIPSGTTFVDGDFTVTFNSGGPTHPIASCALDLGDDFETEDGSGNINSLGISISWAKNSDNLWVATVHQDTPSDKLFLYANALLKGENLVRNNAPTALEGGIYINNVKYRLVPYATGGKTYLTLEAYQ